MTIFTGGARIGRSILEDQPAPLADVLRAQAEEVWTRSPSPSFLRAQEQRTAEGGFVWDQQASEWRRNPVTQLTAEEARRQVEELGLPLDIPDAGITQEKLDLLTGLKTKELRRQSIFARDPGGFVSGSLKLGTGLGVSLLDPVNIALAFVPVIGPARYAMMLERAGGPLARAAVRAGVGTAEGFAGAALAEPLVYAQAQAEQADYTMLDSLLNVAFGAVFGAAVHAGGGALADALRNWRAKPEAGGGPEVSKPDTGLGPEGSKPAPRLTPQERETAFRVTLAQMVEGRRADVTEMVRAFETARDAVDSMVLQREAAQSVAAELRATPDTFAGRLTRGEVKQIEHERAAVAYQLDNLDAAQKARAKELQTTEKMSRKQAESKARKERAQKQQELETRAGQLEATLREGASAKAVEADVSRLEQGIVPERFQSRVAAEISRRAPQRTPVSSAVSRALDTPEQAAMNAMRRSFEPENANPTVTNFKGAQQITEELKTAKNVTDVAGAEQALQDELTALADMETALGVEVRGELASFDAEIDTARSYAKALRQLALCQSRRG